jgi:hypothetical protein
MVLAISFLEAPLKFPAPGVTLHVGLGIGRPVFHALNSAEVLLAVVIVIAQADHSHALMTLSPTFRSSTPSPSATTVP